MVRRHYQALFLNRYKETALRNRAMITDFLYLKLDVVPPKAILLVLLDQLDGGKLEGVDNFN